MAPSAPDPLMRMLSLSDGPVGSPFPDLELDLSEDDIRETAYEIFVAACGHNALSARTQAPKSKAGLTSVSSLTAKGFRKAAVAMGSKRDRPMHPAGKGKKPPTTAEIVQYQMQISQESESRIRKGLLRAFTHQVGKPVECLLVPLELLQIIGPSDFVNPAHYSRWRLRQLRVLEGGLLIYPSIRKEGSDKTLDQRLQKMLHDLQHSSVDTGKSSEEMSALRMAALAKAGRSVSGEHPSPHLHWADGYPLNVSLYLALLSSVFDTLEEGQVIEEKDEVLEAFKKTWGILGINQMLHDLCFMWVLFSQFVATEQLEVGLLEAAEHLMKEVALLAKNNVVVQGKEALKTALTSIHSWAERRLLAYRETFPKGASGVMEALLSIGLLAGRILADDANQVSQRKQKDLSNYESEKVELYIRSSLKAAFAQMMETTDTRRRSFKNGGVSRPPLMVLAADIGQLAEEERLRFSPVLKQWNACAGGIAAATLHACFAREIMQFLSGRQTIGPEVLQVLQGADTLEKELVQIAVEDAVDAEDGGKGLMREMQPYECETTIEKLSKDWLQNGLAQLLEWVGRNIQNEEWKPKGTREGYAPSAVEVLRMMEETMDAFFALPISQDPQYVEQLVSGVESAVQLYCEKTISACGKKERYVPSLPSLTRYNASAFTQKGGWRAGLHLPPKSKIASQVGVNSNERLSELENICVRINTLYHLGTELQYMEKRLRYGWKKEAPSRMERNGHDSPVAGEYSSFKEVGVEIENGVQFLIELSAYRAVFFDLHRVFWEGLYAGGVESARMEIVIEKLERQLEIIAEIAAEGLRNRIVGALMKACMDCLVLVLLAGGPSRAFSIDHADILEEDLAALTDLFTCDGDGLPQDLVDGATEQIRGVLTLFHLSTEKLIERLRDEYPEADVGSASRFKFAALPRTTGEWGPTDANTILRVLCYRGDDQASKYLKKTFNLPKKLSGTK
ncbi:hypothetical protein MPTK1_4g20090 [Marchantia polymorpha subsp. ruderalis]|uniref:MHD1 domain-containing protein n=2 Tax=Marchantia polymorpha TaxID=3197 RepID=A0AAF6BBV1_MARPO|nr:hypothetical protein MARPO_0116s0011 [Marchantia polymorpha]BBN09485.1 hypothetical protein Mp_4g20090 [Marchantia polymorpha subsp. ruderalis]|eukprot:PTQ31021.1 hypothetical protein MARPO_0116s0011 [Marchantia polymorpha]